MKKRIIAAKILLFGGIAAEMAVLAVLFSVGIVPRFRLCAVIVVVTYIPLEVAAHFISRCPNCHMSLHYRASILCDYCPYCGRKFD